MSDTTTTNYALTKPEVGASADTWGGKLNANFDVLDGALKAVSDTAAGVAGKAAKASNLADLTDPAVARGNIGAQGGGVLADYPAQIAAAKARKTAETQTYTWKLPAGG